MKLLDRLESKFGRFAIKDLMLYIVIINFAVFILKLFDPSGTLIYLLTLEPNLILKGELWRLITYIFIPPTFNPIWLFFALYFYYMIGTGLEKEWGSFKFNAFYFLGVIGTIAGSFLTGMSLSAFYLNLTLFLAFAYIYPDFQILLFFILPIKVKYLAWLDLAFFAYGLVTSSLANKVAILIAVANFLLFFGKDIFLYIKDRRHSYNRKQVYSHKLDQVTSVHICHICGITEKKDPLMDFRYCSECNGDYEYCTEHLDNHTHIQ